MPLPIVSSDNLIDGIEQSIGRIDARLGTYLEDVQVHRGVDELRAELCESLRSQGTTPRETFLHLNQQRIMGAASGEVIAGMVLAAIEEAKELKASEPVQAFEWLMRAENALGYGSGLLDAAFHQRQSQESTKKKSVAATKENPQLQALKEDMLAFLDLHQPAGGWTKKRAIDDYADQNIEEASALFRAMPTKDWDDLRDKIKYWLENDPEFSLSFNARLSTKLPILP